MKIPAAVKARLDEVAAKQAAGKITSANAEASLADAIDADPVYTRGVLRSQAARLLAAWHRAHRAAPSPLQLSLFPDLPSELHVSPGVTRSWLDFTRHDWETARNMLLARTSNQVTGAEKSARKEREAFMRAYDQVVPLLATHEMTTADVIGRIADTG